MTSEEKPVLRTEQTKCILFYQDSVITLCTWRISYVYIFAREQLNELELFGINVTHHVERERKKRAEHDLTVRRGGGSIMLWEGFYGLCVNSCMRNILHQ